jgi:peptide/nickel transport system substrate-binding protein
MDLTPSSLHDISRRRFLGTIGIGGAAALALAACGGGSSSNTGASSSASGGSAVAVSNGGTFVVALDADAPTLNPMVSQVNQTFWTCNQIFDTLVKYDNNFKPIPWLAKSWTVSPDGKTYEFEMNTNIKWHDGTPFSNDDIVYTFQEAGPKYSNTYGLVMKNLTSIDGSDPSKIVFAFSKPVGALMSYLGDPNFNVLPKHLFAGTNPATSAVNSKPVGTGPFMFKEWVKGDHLTLVKNPNYWQAGLPHFDTLIFRTVSNPTAAVSALKQSGVNFVMTEVPPVSAQALKSSSSITTLAPSVLARTLNLWPNLRSKTLSNLQVRQALSLVVDRPRMVTDIAFDQTTTARGPIGSKSPYFDKSLPELKQDVAKANSMLDAAGFPKTNGTRFSLNLRVVSSQAQFVRTAQIVKENLADVGISVNIIAAETTTTLDAIFKNWDFDLAVYSMPLGPEPALQLPAWLGAAGINHAYYSNAEGYTNTTVDDLAAQAQQTADTSARSAIYNKIQQQIMVDLPLIPLWEPVLISAYSNDYGNAFLAPDDRYLSFATTGKKK